jgi:cytochrome c oxidase accessory protein FixG
MDAPGLTAKPLSKKERPAPLPPPRYTYHQIRKAIHVVCLLIFVALPFTNVMRVDIPSQRFYFFGAELWINEFGILFFAMMFLLFLIVAVSMLYGRLYCSYLCPQMIFSEWSIGVETWFQKKVTKRWPKWPARTKTIISRAGFYSVLGVASIFLAFVFTAYFVEPRDLLRRLLSLDVQTAGGITGAVVTLITFLDFVLLRQKFCTTVCPYGYLQGMLGDKHTLLVHYRDDQKTCIECKKCVRVCHMGIDIRTSPYQIECIHCGECVDACEMVLGKLGRPTLIHYAWGEKGETLTEKSPWYHKLGLRDAKRVVVMLVILFYAVGLYAAMAMRRSVLVQMAPIRTELYQLAPDGRVMNKFRVKLANRGGADTTIAVRAEGLPQAELTLQPNPVLVKAGAATEVEFAVIAPRFPGARDVNHFRLTATPNNGEEANVFENTFLMPPEKKK